MPSDLDTGFLVTVGLLWLAFMVMFLAGLILATQEVLDQRDRYRRKRASKTSEDDSQQSAGPSWRSAL